MPGAGRPVRHPAAAPDPGCAAGAGIPARLSSTAGTYLCNQALYGFLGAIERSGKAVPCGFIHLPYLPEQVAGMMARMQTERSVQRRQPTDLPSMSLATMSLAVRIALEVTLVRSWTEALRRRPRTEAGPVIDCQAPRVQRHDRMQVTHLSKSTAVYSFG